MEVDIGSGYYEYNDRGFDYQRCINLFPTITESGESKSKRGLNPTPGERLVGSATPNNGSGGRGTYETSGGRFFSVWGDSLFEIDINETITDRNSSLRFARTIGNVSITDNGTQMIIIDQGKGYIYTLATDTIVEITDIDYPSEANQVVFSNDYFVVSVPNTKQFFVSAINDGTSWSSLDVAEIVSQPDNITGIINTNTDLVMFGEKTIEFWQKVNNRFFPFQRINGATQNIGCKNPWSIAKVNNNVYWLGSNKNGFGKVWRMNGYQVQEISTYAIEQKLGEASNQTNATAYAYQKNGYSFYVLSVPAINKTFAYEETTGKWHERAYWDSSNSEFDIHKSSFYAFAFGKDYVTYVGDDNLYELDGDTFTDNGDAIVRLFTTPHLSKEHKNISVNKVELEIERGIGNANPPGSDPMAKMRYSQDGGYTWSNQIMRHIGKSGVYGNEIQWNRLGIGRDYVFEFSFSDPVRFSPHTLYVELEVLAL